MWFRSKTWMAGDAAMWALVLCCACTPTSPPAPPPEAPAKPTGGTGAVATGTAPGAGEKPRDASAELLAKIQPPGLTPPPQAKAPAGPSLLTAEEAARLPKLDALAKALTAALQSGDAKAAEGLTLQGEALGRLILPAYHDILLGSIEEQNRSALRKLATALRDKRLTEEVVPGPVARAPVKGPIVEGTFIMSGATLRLTADGVKVDVGLDQLLLVGEEWKIFRLREP